MGILDRLSSAGDYFKERWNSVKTTYGEAWANTVPENWQKAWSGIFTMAMAPEMPWSDDPNRDAWSKGLRLWLDGSVGVLGGVGTGTIGGAFELPALHETGWLLDKAYRYTFARPVSSLYGSIASASLAADDARKRGDDPQSAYLSYLLGNNLFSTGQWGWFGDDAGKATPGQSIMWAAGGLVGAVNPNNPEERLQWLRSHDPRTPEGQAAYNSEHADIILKYGSGTVDLVGNIVADPAGIAAAGIGAAKLRLANTATADYIAKGNVEKEVGSKTFNQVYEAALDAKTPEEFRERVMSRARFGGIAANILWGAARVSPGVFRDAYVVARRTDGMPMRRPERESIKQGDIFRTEDLVSAEERATTAHERLIEEAPQIFSDFSRIFGNWPIGEDALAMGLRDEASQSAMSLALVDADAFAMQIQKREGPWRDFTASLTGEAQPKVTRLSEVRNGVHRRILGAPVYVSKALTPFMPSQGFTKFLDAEDGTSLALRQFKALLERSGMPGKDVEFWVGTWGRQIDREGRYQVWARSYVEALGHVAKKHGLDVETVKRALPEIARYQTAAKGLVEQSRTFVSSRAARGGRALALLRAGRENIETRRDIAQDATTAEKKGDFGEQALVLPNHDGHTHVLKLPDARIMPGLVDPSQAVLLSQTEKMIPTIDFRALDAQLKWWKWQHRPASTIRGWTLSKVAKTHAVWDSMITSADFAMMVWKASALLRPAQTPRNLADDVLRRMLVFGKLPMLASAMVGAPRVFQNFSRRGVLLHDVMAESIAKGRASRGNKVTVEAEIDVEAPFNINTASVYEVLEGLKDKDKERGQRHVELMSKHLPKDLGQLWIDGMVPFKDFLKIVEATAAHPYLYQTLGPVEQFVRWFEQKYWPSRDTPGPRRSIYETIEKTVDGQRYTAPAKSYNPEDRGQAVGAGAFARDREAEARLREAPKDVKRLTDAENIREFKRQMLMHYFGRVMRPLEFMDDRRVVLEQTDITKSSNVRAQWLDQLRTIHQAYRKSETPYAPGHLFVNPFDGRRPPDVTPDDFQIILHTNLVQPYGVKGGIKVQATDAIERFVLDNLDEFLRPDTVLSMAVDPKGNVRLGVARVKQEKLTVLGVKASARHRLKNFSKALFEGGILDSVHDNIVIKLGDGTTYELDGAFVGEEGQNVQHRVSALGSGGTYNYLVGDVSNSRILDQEGGWGEVNPGQNGYEQSWERAVNAQLAGDPVAKMFLEGKSESDVIHWMERTALGRRYIRRAHYLGVNYVEHVSNIKAFVDEYVPFEDSKAGRTLRAAVIERVATYDHLKAVRPDLATQPPVHGASLKYALGKGAIFDMISRGVDGMQKLLSDLPTDKASRFPFFAEAYRRHLHELVRTADMSARKFGDDILEAEDLRRIEHQARERALYDTKYRLYDVAQMNDLARLSRLIVPFSSAIMDSYIKYGRIIRDNPGVILQGLYYWEMFERNDAVQDENGYVLRRDASGRDRWYAKDPESGELTEVPAEMAGKHRYVQFRRPSAQAHMVGKRYYGVNMEPVFAVNKKSFNVFLDLPSTGPLVAIPANEFALDHPEFGESEVVRKFVLPFGPSVEAGRVYLPSNVRAAWEVFAGEDGLKAEAQAKAIFQAELISYARGERRNPPSFAEVRDRAAMMKGLRFAATWITPVSFQVQSPYQPYLDAYRQLAAADPKSADEKFLAQYGDEFYAVAMTVTRNNAGINASLKSHQAFLRHKDLISQFPELAGLITAAEGGPFAKSVYEAQKQTPLKLGSSEEIRQIMSLDESVQELEKRRVWDEYSKLMVSIRADMVDMGITSLRNRRAAELVKLRDAFIDKNKFWVDPSSGKTVLSPWYNDFTAVDHAAMDKRIMAMWTIIQDPDLQKRDDIRGLIDYLSLREKMQTLMKRRGVKTLSNRNAVDLRDQWDRTVHSMVDTNPEFAGLWSRWLSRDDQLELPVGGDSIG